MNVKKRERERESDSQLERGRLTHSLRNCRERDGGGTWKVPSTTPGVSSVPFTKPAQPGECVWGRGGGGKVLGLGVRWEVRLVIWHLGFLAPQSTAPASADFLFTSLFPGPF